MAVSADYAASCFERVLAGRYRVHADGRSVALAATSRRFIGGALCADRADPCTAANSASHSSTTPSRTSSSIATCTVLPDTRQGRSKAGTTLPSCRSSARRRSSSRSLARLWSMARIASLVSIQGVQDQRSSHDDLADQSDVIRDFAEQTRHEATRGVLTPQDWIYTLHHGGFWYSSVLGKYRVFRLMDLEQVDGLVAHWRKLRPRVLTTLPSYLPMLASIGSLRRYGIEAITTNSEMSSREERSRYSQLFDAGARRIQFGRDRVHGDGMPGWEASRRRGRCLHGNRRCGQ